MKKSKLCHVFATLVLFVVSGTLSISAYADTGPNSSYNYQFNSGPETSSTFGSPTMTDIPGSNPLLYNIRRNKDVAYLPPGYGIFSGELPTNPSSLYHSAVDTASVANVTNNGSASVNYYGETTGLMQPTSITQLPDSAGGSGSVNVSYVYPCAAGADEPTSARVYPADPKDGRKGYV